MKLKAKHLILSSVLTLAMTVTAICSAVSIAGATEPANKADLKKDMSVTVKANDGAIEYINEVPETEGYLVYDLYKVATAEDKGSGVSFKITDEFSSLSNDFKDIMDISKGADQKKFMEFAQKCLSLKYTEDEVVVPKSPAYSGKTLNSKVSLKNDPGIYLLVVRGSVDNSTKIKNYVVNSADATQEKAAENGCATVTKLGGYTFTCSPILFASPTKAEALSNTTDDNPWIYDQEIVLKMIAEPETGSIIIDKTLTGYNEGSENATFIFQVDYEYGEKKSSEVYTMVFTKGGNQSVQVDGIPYGAKVTVTEVYSGVGYECKSAKSQTINELVKIESAADIPHVAFENEYNKWQGGSGGITNHFSYEEGNGGATWEWTKVNGNVTTQNGRPNAFSKQAEENN